MRWTKQIVQIGFHLSDAELVAFKLMFGAVSLVWLGYRVNQVRPSLRSCTVSTGMVFPLLPDAGFLYEGGSKQAVSVHPK